MKTFNRTSLPESINYNGEVYTNDIQVASISKNRDGKLVKSYVGHFAKAYNKKAVIVKVLSSRLKGKTDLYNQPYQPTEWVYTNKK